MQKRMMMVLLLLFLKLTVEQQKSEGKGILGHNQMGVLKK